jgi:hypothetical protein
MKTLSFVKAALGSGAAILLAGLLAAAPAAQASTAVSVRCNSQALIEAINAANSSGGATINLAPGCTYRLTTPYNSSPSSPLGANGLPVITSKITLNGFRTTIAGNHSDFRIFMVTASGNLTLQGLTITGGNTPAPTATTLAPGGGIFNLEGTLTLNHSLVTGNTSGTGGGGITSGTMGTGPVGTTTLNFSQVDDNTVTDGNSGGGILNHGGTLILNASQVNDNTSSAGGGGITSGTGMGGVGGSILVLNFSQVNGNTADASSLGGPMAGAGGIVNGGTATINASVVDGNTAPGAAGGGILNHGTMTINLSQVNNNTAPGNSAGQGDGGGIANLNFGLIPMLGATNGGFLTITASQIRGNTASAIGGGIVEASVSPSGTLTAPGNQLILKFSLVTGNTAAEGGGIYAVSGSPVALKLTLVAKNIPDNCFPLGSIAGCKS